MERWEVGMALLFGKILSKQQSDTEDEKSTYQDRWCQTDESDGLRTENDHARSSQKHQAEARQPFRLLGWMLKGMAALYFEWRIFARRERPADVEAPVSGPLLRVWGKTGPRPL